MKTRTSSIFRIGLLFLLPALAQGKADSYRLTWRGDPATTMVIGWNQVSGTNATVCYGTVDHGTKAEAYRSRRAPDRVETYREMSNHFARLENLQPDTAYYFVVSDSEGVGRRLWFRTAPATPKPFTFIAGGDSRSNAKMRREGNKLVAKLRPLFVLFGGDYTGVGNPRQWAEWFKDWQLTISEDGRIYPIIATHGNHENADLLMIEKLFDSPHPDQYYSLGLAGGLMRIWALNSELQYKAKSKVPKQQAWIEKDLPAHSNVVWKVATYHRPMRAHTAGKSEGERRIAAWAQLFYDQGVDLVIESDTHMVKRTYPLRPFDGPGSHESFIRDDPKGVVFIGEGSWGAPRRPPNDDKPWTMVSDSFYQFKWIMVSPKEMYIRTVKFENVDAVVPLTDATRFQEPESMVFWTPESGKILRLPFDVNHPTFTAPVKPRVLFGLGGLWDWSLDGQNWLKGKAPLGYGDDHVKTPVAPSGEKPTCAFFRREFNIDDPAAVSRLFFDVIADDGCIVKLNGEEVLWHNMPRKDVTDETLATDRVGGRQETTAIPIAVDPAGLKQGINTIEVRVHQCSAESSDLIFDLAVRIKNK